MPRIKIKDSDGQSLDCFDYNGYYLGTFEGDQQKRMDDLQKFTARPNDVWVCTWVKSGTHWVWEISNMLMRNSTKLEKRPKEDFMVEANDLDWFDNMADPRIINAHCTPKYLPPAAKNARMIQMLRNPKDVAVSYYNHCFGLVDYNYSGTFSAFLDLYMTHELEWGSWFSYVREWSNFQKEDPNAKIHWVTYEGFQLDTINEIKKLADFLGCSVTLEFCEEIANATDFSKMKKDKNHWDSDMGAWKENSGGWYRKGKVGDWVNYFTVSQSRAFDKVYEEKMRDLPNIKTMIQFEL